MPPKAKKSKLSSDAKYLFVNEDASTVLSNTRDTELDRSKQSHVQRRQFAKKRDELANVASAQPSTANRSASDMPGFDTLTIASPQGPPGGFLTSSDYFSLFNPSLVGDDLRSPVLESGLYSNLLLEEFRISPFATTSQPSSPLFATSGLAPAAALPQALRRGSSQQRPWNERATPGRRSIAPSSMALSPTRRVHADPFADTFLALERWAPPLIQYYTTVVVPHLFATELKTVPMQFMRHTPALHADMQTCMADAAHMYALLACVSARMLRYEGRLLLPGVDPEDYTRVPLFFKTKAITSLRQKLERGQLDRLLAQDVYRLMASAVMMDDMPAADAHFQAMTEMVRGLGGLETFDDYVKERMILVDIWRACLTWSKPKYQLSWDPGHLPEDFRSEIKSDEYKFTLGSGFDRADISQILGVDTLQLISALTEVIDLARYSFANHLASHSFQWQLLRRAAIEYQLLSNFASVVNEENIMAETTRLAILIWIGLVLAERNKQLLSNQVHTMRTHLEANHAELETKYTGLVFWIATTGSIATIDEDDSLYFRNMARRQVKELEINSVDDLEEQLHGLLYVAEMQREALTTLMDRLGEDEKGKSAANDPV